MSLESHLSELKRKHIDLSEKIEQVQKSPSVSQNEVAALKKQKLHLKEQIERLRANI